MVYLDDVLIIDKNFVEHFINMRKVFDRFRLANLSLSLLNVPWLVLRLYTSVT